MRMSLLISSVGRKTEHAGQTTTTLTGLHAHFGKARDALIRVSALLKDSVARAADQFDAKDVWQLCYDHISPSLSRLDASQMM